MCSAHNLRTQFECQKWWHRVTMMAPRPNTIFQFQSVSTHTQWQAHTHTPAHTHQNIIWIIAVRMANEHDAMEANQFALNIINEMSFHRTNSMPFLTRSALSFRLLLLRHGKKNGSAIRWYVGVCAVRLAFYVNFQHSISFISLEK